MTPQDFKPGEKVVYIGNPFKRPEKGVVKKVQLNLVFVVFNCGEDWDNYEQYTASGCSAINLKKGWK